MEAQQRQALSLLRRAPADEGSAAWFEEAELCATLHSLSTERVSPHDERRSALPCEAASSPNA
jgi:hypothetical protein